MHTIDLEQAQAVPVAEQQYAFGAPVFRLTYCVDGREVTKLVIGGFGAVRAYAQRCGYRQIVIGRYLGGS